MREHPALPQVAAVLGRLMAQGLLAPAEADAGLSAVPPPCADASGWQARRRWALADAAADWRRARQRSVWRMTVAVRPLLAARASRAELETAAAGADRAGALLERERAALLVALVQAALR
jgi:hypothetical protein